MATKKIRRGLQKTPRKMAAPVSTLSFGNNGNTQPDHVHTPVTAFGATFCTKCGKRMAVEE